LEIYQSTKIAITKIQSESMNLADTYAFTGTVTGASTPMTPAFEAYTDTTTSISNDTATKMTFANTVHNTGSGWDTSNNKFLPTTAGKYYVYGCVEGFAGASTSLTDARPMIYKNGSMVRQTPFFFQDSRIRYGSFFVDGTYDLNGSSDYIEMYFQINSHDTQQVYEKYFGAFRILT
jgi:hypothetical protein